MADRKNARNYSGGKVAKGWLIFRGRLFDSLTRPFLRYIAVFFASVIIVGALVIGLIEVPRWKMPLKLRFGKCNWVFETWQKENLNARKYVVEKEKLLKVL